jgi:hypothetical protein
MDDKKMETIVKFKENVSEKEQNKGYIEFISDFSSGYLEVEFLEKQSQLSEYIKAYSLLDDKESFHGQYLLSLIEFLRAEI